MEVGDASVIEDVLHLLDNDSDLDSSQNHDDEFVNPDILVDVDSDKICLDSLELVGDDPFLSLFELPGPDVQFGGASPPRLLIPVEVNLEVAGSNVRIKDHWTTFNERFGIDGVVYRFVPELQENVEEVVDSFRIVIDEIFNYLHSNFNHDVYVEFYINGDGFKSGGFSLPLTKIQDLDKRALLNQFLTLYNLTKISRLTMDRSRLKFTMYVYQVVLDFERTF